MLNHKHVASDSLGFVQRLWIGLIIVPEAIPQRLNLTQKESPDTNSQNDAAKHSVIFHPFESVFKSKSVFNLMNDINNMMPFC